MPHSATTTIGQKITTIVMLTSTIVLLMSLATAVYIQGTTFQNSMIDKLATLAKIIGENSKQALAINKKHQAQRIIESLEQEPTIQVAYLFNQKNEIFADYRNNSSTTFAKELKKEVFRPERIELARDQKSMLHFLELKHLTIYSPVYDHQEYRGCVYLQMDQSLILRNLLWFAVAGLGIFALTLAVAYLLINRLRNLITSPLNQLVDRMQAASNEQEYSCKSMPMINSDIIEIKELLGGFCHMLGQIEKREDALYQYSHHLEDEVQERTKDLRATNNELHGTIQQLDMAKKEALEASAAKSRFLANMSHEIRTPMIGVLGMAEMLIKDNLSSQQAELARTIHSSGESLMAILNDLLDISKIEAGKLELELHPFCPTTAIDQAVELLADKAFSKTVELTTWCHANVPVSLTGDAGRLRQILLNLLSNAIKFTEQGSIVVELSWQARSTQQGQLILSVADSGIGLSEAAKESVFTAFTQADSSTSRKYGGTGLGLTIVKQFSELMGGNVTVKDNTPSGSIFTVTLPFAGIEAQSMPASEPSASPDLFSLIATDNDALEQLLREQLGRQQHQIAVFPHTTQLYHALTAQQKTTMDYLFIDSAVPGGAIALLQDLKQIPPAQRPKRIIYMGPRNQMFAPEQSEALNIGNYLAKPVQNQALKRCLTPTQSTDDMPCEPSSPVPAEEKHQNGAKILLAEDNPTNQRLVQLILEPAGYPLTIVNNGQQAVDIMEQEPFDLLLMDCQMPLMDGYEATRIIRQNSQIPIIALTAHAGKEDVELCQQAGMDDYLCKPYRQQQLLALVERYLG